MLLRVVVAFAALALPTVGSSDRAIKIVDGDTLRIGDATYRLNGIDAPEAGQKCLTERGKQWACGEAAMDRLHPVSPEFERTLDVNAQSAEP